MNHALRRKLKELNRLREIERKNLRGRMKIRNTKDKIRYFATYGYSRFRPASSVL